MTIHAFHPEHTDDHGKVFCSQGNHLVEEDKMVHKICVDCFFKGNQCYECLACDHQFTHTGIPAECPKCESWHITSGWTIPDLAIEENNMNRAKEMLSQPFVTPLILEAMKEENRTSVLAQAGMRTTERA